MMWQLAVQVILISEVRLPVMRALPASHECQLAQVFLQTSTSCYLATAY